MLRAIVLIPMLIFVLPVVIIAAGLLFVFAGSPAQCGGGRDVQVSPALSQSYEQRWLAFNATLTRGQPATLAVSDSEATSRTRDFLAASEAPVKDLRICFVDNAADVNGTITTPFGPDVTVRVKGNADLSGAHPRARIDSIQIGGLPSFVARPFRGLITRIIDDQTDQIALDHRLSVDLTEGQAQITGQP
jgi:hypothetical protein